MAAAIDGMDKFRRGPGPIFWLSWVAATLAGTLLPLAWSAATSSISGLSAGVLSAPWGLGMLVSLASVGIAQVLVLLPYFKLNGSLEWLAATIAGQLLILLIAFLGFASILMGTGLGLGIFTVTLFPFLAVIIAALPQWFVLKDRVANAWQWIVANVVVTLLTLFVAPFLFALPTLAFSTMLALITGIVTASAMDKLMRVPGPKATWDLGIKAAPRSPKKYREEVQASPEELLARMRNEDNTGK